MEAKHNQSIIVNSINHQFITKEGKITLFNDLYMTINSGETHAIVGPSGVGKSSLLLILAALEKPTSGQWVFSINGEYFPADQLKKHSGFIFQQFQLLPELDAISNVALPLKLKGDKKAMEKAYQWLERVGLGDRSSHKPAELSGGEQQRVAIARAFVSEPAFVFADEPTGNLDTKTTEYITKLMFDCCKVSGTALVIVTHDNQLAARADFCHQLGDGQLKTVANQTSTNKAVNGGG